LSFQCWSLVWVTLTIAQSSTWEDNNKKRVSSCFEFSNVGPLYGSP
jgi:hypothetical protein